MKSREIQNWVAPGLGLRPKKTCQQIKKSFCMWIVDTNLRITERIPDFYIEWGRSNWGEFSPYKGSFLAPSFFPQFSSDSNSDNWELLVMLMRFRSPKTKFLGHPSKICRRTKVGDPWLKWHFQCSVIPFQKPHNPNLICGH